MPEDGLAPCARAGAAAEAASAAAPSGKQSRRVNVMAPSSVSESCASLGPYAAKAPRGDGVALDPAYQNVDVIRQGCQVSRTARRRGRIRPPLRAQAASATPRSTSYPPARRQRGQE